MVQFWTVFVVAVTRYIIQHFTGTTMQEKLKKGGHHHYGNSLLQQL